MRNHEIAAFASTHHGLVTRDVAIRLGMSPRSWYRAIDAGALVPVHRRVARLPGVPLTRPQEILAAVWAIGPTAMASHRSALHVWGVEGIDRPTDLRNLRPVVRSGIPVTAPLRAIVDLGAVASHDEVYDAMEQLIVARVFPPKAAANALLAHAERGRTGITALRAAIERYPLAEQVADSTLETKMAQLVERFTWKQLVGAPEKVALRIRRVVECWAPDLAAKTERSRTAR